MMTTPNHPLLVDYLNRLREQAHSLPADQAAELVADIEEHLASALPRGGDHGEAEIRQVLDRLGTPVELVRAARRPGPEAGEEDAALGQPVPDRGRGYLEAGSIVLLVGALLVAIIWPLSIPMWIAGLAMLVLAKRWSVGQKVLGGLVLGAGMPLSLFALGSAAFLTMQTCETVTTSSSTGEVITQNCADPGLAWFNYLAIGLSVAYLGLLVWTILHLARAARRPF